jgi:hypothetical protein
MATWKKVIADGSSLSDIGTPASDDKILIQDTSDSDVVKYVDWSDVGGGGDVVSDTTPQLGGDLDLNSNDITGTGNINITGTLNTSGLATLPGISLGSTGILGTGGISTTGNISTLGSGNISSAGTLSVTGNATFNSNLYTSGVQFTGSGTNIIGPSGTGGTQDDLEIRSNGNITAVLDYDSDEAAQAFIVKNQAGTIIFQVDEDGISSGLFTSATPSLATVSNWENSQTGTLTVSNYVSSATYEVKLYNSSDVEQTSQTITNNNDGTFSITSAPVLTGAYFTVRSVEFGELVSQTATSNTFNITAPATSKRYWRLQMTDASKNPVSSQVALGDFRLYTATGGGGTAYPSNMTSATTPSPYVVTEGYEYSSTYAAWKAFDGSGSSASSMWWSLGNSTAANNWIQIDLGSSIEMGSGECQITTSGGWTSANYAVLYGSDTGSFSGEEREMAFFQNIDKAGESGGTFTTYTEAIT